MNASDFFDRLWADYVAIAPQAARIRSAFEARGEAIVSDHVAFRTLAAGPLGLERLEQHLLDFGYRRYQAYEFPDKKLRAWGYLPPRSATNQPIPSFPRVFLSELLVDDLSPPSAAILRRIADSVDPTRVGTPEVLLAGRLWDAVSWEEYRMLEAESEYAAWVAALGLHANHFTISVNHLKTLPSLEAVLDFVESLGIAINETGGRMKGSPDVLLEQGSTLADRMPVEFADGGRHTVPTCYYEFARRYPTAEGTLFQGFVPASASQIFSSTDRTLAEKTGTRS
jgi:hypothetical protein